MDTFVEQIVVKRKDGKDYGIIAAIMIGMLVLMIGCFFLFYFIYMLSLILLFGGGYGAWRLLLMRNIEFEYSVTNGDIDIDTIIAQRKRKRIVSVAGAKLEMLEPYNQAAYTTRKFDRLVMAAPSLQDEELWCFSYRSKKNGHTLVVFQPEKRVLAAMKFGLQPLVAREFNKKFKAAFENKTPDDAQPDEVRTMDDHTAAETDDTDSGPDGE